MEYAEMAAVEDAIAPDDPERWDELQVRDALLELRALEEERKRVLALGEAILDRYQRKGETLARRADSIRQSVQNYLTERNGGQKLSFPDVGTAYLTTRKAKANVGDVAALETYLYEIGEDGAIAYDQKVNATATLELALDQLGYTVTANGELVDANGEVQELPGVEVKPEGKTLAVRSA